MKTNITPKKLKDSIITIIDGQQQDLSGLTRDPQKDFTRTRKITYKDVMLSNLSFENRSLPNELMDYFGVDHDFTTSAYIQQRDKILPTAFEDLFRKFTNQNVPVKRYKGMQLLAVDASIVNTPKNSDDKAAFIVKKEGYAPYNLYSITALYDLLNTTYSDVVINKIRNSNERNDLIKMVDSSQITDKNVLIIADRGYESYNCIAHIIEKGWKFLIRVKSITSTGILKNRGLPERDEFDTDLELKLIRSRNKNLIQLCKEHCNYQRCRWETSFDFFHTTEDENGKYLSYDMNFRVVRVDINETTTEMLITNLSREDFSVNELKKLYSMRWGIENSFRELKYTIGLNSFHSKQDQCIIKEFYARLILYNFVTLITSVAYVNDKDRKYRYRINFSQAVLICREFLKGNVSHVKIKKLIAKYISPIRPGRSNPRNTRTHFAISFNYRVA